MYVYHSKEPSIKLSHKKSEEGQIKSNVIFIPMLDNFLIYKQAFGKTPEKPVDQRNNNNVGYQR